MTEKPEITAGYGMIGNAFYAEHFMMTVVYREDGSLQGVDIEIGEGVKDI